jgi:hypothetical protein
MTLSFDAEDWKKSIQDQDFSNEEFGVGVETPEGEVEEYMHRGVTYDLTEGSITDEAYQESLQAGYEHDEHVKRGLRQAGKMLGDVIYKAAQASFNQWTEAEKLEDPVGRDRIFEAYGSPFLRVVDDHLDSDNLSATIGAEPINAVFYAQEHFEYGDKFDTPENFLEGMEATMAENSL